MELMERYWGRIWRGVDGTPVRPGSHVETLSGKIRIVESIDKDGYARLQGEVNSFYTKHLTWVLPGR